jgi:hypothetical protein
MIERRPFGRTGHQSTVTLFGGAALARATQAEADQTLELLLRHGVNHLDTAARYGDSELRIGPWMARHRKDFFLATKTGERAARNAVMLSFDRCVMFPPPSPLSSSVPPVQLDLRAIASDLRRAHGLPRGRAVGVMSMTKSRAVTKTKKTAAATKAKTGRDLKELVLTLSTSGEVAKIEHAEAAVKSIEGVSSVVNTIEVLPKSADDNELRRDAYAGSVDQILDEMFAGELDFEPGAGRRILEVFRVVVILTCSSDPAQTLRAHDLLDRHDETASDCQLLQGCRRRQRTRCGDHDGVVGGVRMPSEFAVALEYGHAIAEIGETPPRSSR